jgi:uncharacterized protein YuzB (UPF0349 family)
MWLLLSLWLVAALPSDTVGILESAPELTVYSIDPDGKTTPLERLDQTKTFHGYRIRNRVDIKGEPKSELLGKLYTAIAENPAPARCYVPRHGIRARTESRSVDMVICFQCAQARIYVVDGKQVRGTTLSEWPQKHFDDALATNRSDKNPAP